MKFATRFFQLALLTSIGFGTANVQAGGDEGMYAVSVTNLTRGQTFTPIMVATHTKGTHIFNLGEPASAELAAIAEGGDIAPLSTMLTDSGAAYDIQTNGGYSPRVLARPSW